jgi:hypothetical protein
MFLEIHNAEYLEKYKIKLWFSNGDIVIADLKESLDTPVFQPLKDFSAFQDFYIEYGTLRWASGADLAPEFLYKIGKKVAVEEVQDPGTSYFRKENDDGE